MSKTQVEILKILTGYRNQQKGLIKSLKDPLEIITKFDAELINAKITILNTMITDLEYISEIQ